MDHMLRWCRTGTMRSYYWLRGHLGLGPRAAMVPHGDGAERPPFKAESLDREMRLRWCRTEMVRGDAGRGAEFGLLDHAATVPHPEWCGGAYLDRAASAILDTL
ncbi:hypothetical protein ACFQ6N_33305 [Kitasatospora sp. NPDC056446]|uniref:hypothetical protein n=1 Tax=Kitasatospora sp. NPDC056446 TaxID=3345819 RepID=UPI0036A3891B